MRLTAPCGRGSVGGFFAPVVAHRRPFDGIQSAFEFNERYADGVGKLALEL